MQWWLKVESILFVPLIWCTYVCMCVCVCVCVCVRACVRYRQFLSVYVRVYIYVCMYCSPGRLASEGRSSQSGSRETHTPAQRSAPARGPGAGTRCRCHSHCRHKQTNDTQRSLYHFTALHYTELVKRFEQHMEFM